MIGKSKYRDPSRELLGGVKQQVKCIELALEFPSESRVGPDEGPSLQGQDIGIACIWSKRVVNHPSSLLAKVFYYPGMNFRSSFPPGYRGKISVSGRVHSIWNEQEWYRGIKPFRLFIETEGFFTCAGVFICAVSMRAAIYRR